MGEGEEIEWFLNLVRERKAGMMPEDWESVIIGNSLYLNAKFVVLYICEIDIKQRLLEKDVLTVKNISKICV